MNAPKLVKYVNLQISNNNVPLFADNVNLQGQPIRAEIRAQWDKSVIKNTQKYSLAVERMQLSANSLPMFPALDMQNLPLTRVNWGIEAGDVGKVNTTDWVIVTNDWSITVNELSDNPTLGGTEDPEVHRLDLREYKSIAELIEELNNWVFPRGTLDGDPPKFHISLRKDGKVKMYWNKFPAYYLVFGKELARLLGVPVMWYWDVAKMSPAQRNVLFTDTESSEVLIGSVSIFDRCLAAKSVRLTSDLPVVSDIVGDTQRANVITDFRIPFSYTQTFDGAVNIANEDEINAENSVSYAPPQVIVYEPKVKRFLDFKSPNEVRRLRIKAQYEDFKGQISDWFLYPGEFFSIKLGFYLK